MPPEALVPQQVAIPPWLWAGFIVLVVTAMVIDLGLIHRKSREVGMRESIVWVCIWVSLALLFNIGVGFKLGAGNGVLFFICYIVELSLSVDNLFVFLIIFFHFGVAAEHQRRVLFWGIIGAVVMRLLFILAGIELVERFEWLFYVFGVLLFIAAYKLLFGKAEDFDPEKSLILRLARKVLPVTREHHGPAFFVRGSKLMVTPLFLVLIVVEGTDVIFAVDSVPAVLGLLKEVKDPNMVRFLAYTSNIFAILGLRAMYFVLSGTLDKFAYLKFGLSLILLFISVKLFFHHVEVHPLVSLGIVLGILAATVAASVLYPPRRDVFPPEGGDGDTRDGDENAGGGRSTQARVDTEERDEEAEKGTGAGAQGDAK